MKQTRRLKIALLAFFAIPLALEAQQALHFSSAISPPTGVKPLSASATLVGTPVLSKVSPGATCSTTPPASTTSFLTTDPVILVWFELSGASNGDNLLITWTDPSHTLQSSLNSTIGPLTGINAGTNYTFCGGFKPNSSMAPGTWTVNVFLDQNILFTLPFTVTNASSGGGGSGPVTINFPNFSSTTGLNLVENTATAAGYNGQTVLRLTPAIGNQGGAAWSTSSISFSSSSATFSTFFQFQITNPGGIDPADGIVFALQPVSSDVGGIGESIGYGGLSPSVGIEFDTYQNAWDPNDNHVGVDIDGGANVPGTLTSLVTANPYGVTNCTSPVGVTGCMANGHLWSVWIDYNGTTLTVALADNSNVRPSTNLLSYNINIPCVLAGGTTTGTGCSSPATTAYVGFTSGTGAGWENHDIVDWQYTNTYSPVGSGSGSSGTGSGSGSTQVTITTPATLPSGTVRVAYSQGLAATGGSGYVWTRLSGSLPPGLNLSSSGAITGTPTAAGSFSFTVSVTDSASISATQTFSLTIGAGLTITTTTTLPQGMAGVAYTQTLLASGGKSPYVWTTTSNPPGLTLSSSGTIGGTPTTAGQFSYPVTVTDANFSTASLTFTLTIAASSTTNTGVIVSDSFYRSASSGCTLGPADLFAGGSGTHYYLPLNGGSTPAALTLGPESGLYNPGLDYAGVQFTSSAGACSNAGIRGETYPQDLVITVALQVPQVPGNVCLASEAGPYFRSRAAAAGDGIIGGTSAGYWVQLVSTGEVRIRGLNPNSTIASSGIPSSFSSIAAHTLKAAVQGSNLQALLDRKLVTFNQNGAGTTTVTLPPSSASGTNNGTVGIAFAAEDNRGQAGGQYASDLIVSNYSAPTSTGTAPLGFGTNGSCGNGGGFVGPWTTTNLGPVIITSSTGTTITITFSGGIIIGTVIGTTFTGSGTMTSGSTTIAVSGTLTLGSGGTTFSGTITPTGGGGTPTIVNGTSTSSSGTGGSSGGTSGSGGTTTGDGDTTGGGGSNLSETSSNSSTAVDLTTESGGLCPSTPTAADTAAGVTCQGDWTTYGGETKSGGGKISALTTVPPGLIIDPVGDPRSLSWDTNDGYPFGSNPGESGTQSVGGKGNGFTFTAPASTTTRTLIVHVGGMKSSGTLTAHLSDSSSPDFTATTPATAASWDRNYTLVYRVNTTAANQTIQITWTLNSDLGNGNVSIAGAAFVLGGTLTGSGGTGTGGSSGGGTCAPTASNLIGNGSFEMPGGSTELAQTGSFLPCWTITNGNVDYVQSGSSYPWTAADGTGSLDMDGNTAGTIVQTFAASPNTSYKVSFALAGNPGGGPIVKTLVVSAAGQMSTFTFDTTGKTTSNMGWVTENFCFATNASTTSVNLQFASGDSAGNLYGPALDNVIVTAVSSPCTTGAGTSTSGGGNSGGGTGGGGSPTANLIRNGDAEQPLANGAIPQWTTTQGDPITTQYSSSGISPTSPGPPNRGQNYFTGSPANGYAVAMTQTDTIPLDASVIDGGKTTFVLDGWLGGYGTVTDSPTVTLTFLNASGSAMPGPVTIGPVTGAVRAADGTANGMEERKATGSVPSGARSVRVDVVIGSSPNPPPAGDGPADAICDNLSLILTPGGTGGSTGGNSGGTTTGDGDTTGGGGSNLSGTSSNSSTAVDLTTESGGLCPSTPTAADTAAGVTCQGDWTTYCGETKSGGGKISALTTVPPGLIIDPVGDPRSLSWDSNDGYPFGSNPGESSTQSVGGKGNGFTFTAPASTTTRTLIVHVGGMNSSGTLTAHLSDSSSPDFTATTPATAASWDRNYTLVYRVNSTAANQTIQITWTMNSDLGNGNVSIAGAAFVLGGTLTGSGGTGTGGSTGGTGGSTPTFTGPWTTNLGPTTLTQSGTTVTGTLPNSGSLNGTVTVSGTATVLVGKWTNPQGGGSTTLTLSPGGSTFTGSWTATSGNGDPSGNPNTNTTGYWSGIPVSSSSTGQAGCNYNILQSGSFPISVSVSGVVNGLLTVVTANNCAWQLSVPPDAQSWVTPGSGTTGPGATSYTVQPNTGPARGTVMTLGNVLIPLNQAGLSTCTFGLSAPSVAIPAGGGSGSVLVSTPGSSETCAWTVVPDPNNPWAHLISAPVGTGSRYVNYQVDPNTSTSSRQAMWTVAGQPYAINQPGAAVSSGAVPVIAPGGGGITNSASFIPSDSPAGSIAQGSFFSIFGTNLGPAQPMTATGYPRGTNLGGVTVTITGPNGTQVSAYPEYVAPFLVNAVMPSNAPTGTVQVTVSYNGVTSASQTATVVPNNFGAFAVAAGRGPGIVQNVVVSGVSTPLNTASVTAQPADYVLLWGTGLGPLPAGLSDAASPDATYKPQVSVQVYVGGVLANSQDPYFYAGRAPGIAGVDVIQFPLPPTVPLGCYVPVQVVTNGALYSNTVTMAINTNRQPCVDSNPLSNFSRTAGKDGTITLTRLTVSDYNSPSTTSTVDVGIGTFVQQPGGGDLGFSLFTSFPPSNSCTYYNNVSLLNGFMGGQLPAASGAARSLDAGSSITISGSQPAQNITYSNSSTAQSPYFGLLGAGGGLAGVLSDGPPFLNPGAFIVTGSGGKDVGPFSVNINVPPGVTWTNRNQIGVIDRTQGLTINWSGGNPATQVGVIMGFSSNQVTNVSVAFTCTATLDQGSFTVPPGMLANFPSVTGTNPGDVQSTLMFLTIPTGNQYVNFNTSAPPNLDNGLGFYAIGDLRNVTFQ